MKDDAVAPDTVLNSAAPFVTPPEAVEIAKVHFGISAIAESLSSERDTNFHLVARDGRGYALKFANSAEPPLNTNFQTEALLHMQREDPTLPVPKVVASLSGAPEILLTLSDGRRSVVRVLTWVEGVQLHQVPITRALRAHVGSTLARIGKVLKTFNHPAAELDLLWDIKNAARLRAMVPAIPDAPMRLDVLARLDRFDAVIAPALAGLRRQVIHNDLNHHNAVVDESRPDRISGVLDFGDMVKTALVIDVAVAASYITSLDDDPLESVTDLVAAYHAVYPLTGAEIEILHDLIVTRLVTTIVITDWRAARYPENAAYILRNNGPARRGMNQFARLPREAVTRKLLKSCGLES